MNKLNSVPARGTMLLQLDTELPRLIELVRRAHGMVAAAPQPTEHLAIEPEPEAEAATSVAAAPAAAPGTVALATMPAPGVTSVSEWLASLKLDKFAAQFEEEGYEDMEFLLEEDEVALDTFMAEAGMKPAHIKKLKRERAKLVGGR